MIPNPLPLVRRHPWRRLALVSMLSLPLLAVGLAAIGRHHQAKSTPDQASLEAGGGRRWVESRTQDVFVGDSPERTRWAQMTDQQRDAATCMGAHGIKDALEGHPREFCRPYVKQILAEVARLKREAAVRDEH